MLDSLLARHVEIRRADALSTVLSAVLALTVSLLAGCGGGTNSAPVIDKLDLPATATSSGGAYVLQGTVGFHDDDGTVSTLRVYVPTSRPEPIVSPPITPPVARGEARLAVSFSGVGPGTKIDYEIAVVDSEGLESAHSKKSVVLQ